MAQFAFSGRGLGLFSGHIQKQTFGLREGKGVKFN